MSAIATYSGENVYLYGQSKPGERYASEAAAREAYHRHLEAVSRGESGLPLSEQKLHEQETQAHWQSLEQSSPFNARAGQYAASHPSPTYRANEE
jgi:hypothetical protein